MGGGTTVGACNAERPRKAQRGPGGSIKSSSSPSVSACRACGASTVQAAQARTAGQAPNYRKRYTQHHSTACDAPLYSGATPCG
jgi:hypothetical protein